MPKTNAEYVREHRARKKAAENKIKKTPKTSTERVRNFRARKRALQVKPAVEYFEPAPFYVSFNQDAGNNSTNKQCKPAFGDDVDIEEHNILENPLVRKIFPDITKLKQELDEDAPPVRTETRAFQANEKVVYGNQPPTAATWLPITCKVEFDENISENENSFRNIVNTSNENNTQFNLEISTDLHEASKDQMKKYNIECELVLKEEILTCKVCYKESEEEMCKQCVLESTQGCTPCSPSDKIVFHALEIPKKAPEKTVSCDTSIHTSDQKPHIQKQTKEIMTKKKKRNKTHKTSNSVTCKRKEKSKLKNVSCNLCEYKCAYESQLAQHFRTHTGEKPHNCDLCDYTCSQSSLLKTHIKIKHTNEKNYSCSMCDFKAATKGHLTQHFRKHTGEKPHKCDLCDYTCLQRILLNKHIRSKHTNETNYSCSMCDFKSVTESDLTQHFREHPEQKHKCDLCDYTCSRISHFKKHMIVQHTNQKNYPCNMCKDKFVTKTQLNNHVRKHTGEKPYKCDLCDYTCSQSTHLKVHIRAKHTNEKNYSCNLCEFKSVTKSHLNLHIRKHTGEKPHKCDLCDFTCLQSSHLKHHIKSKHTNEKNYSCNMCEFKSVTKNHLNCHIRKHTGEKPYKCDFCDYKFSQSNHLRHHVRAKHTNEKNYSCNVCEFKCVTKSYLKVHLRKHTGEKPHKCDLCDYTCSQISQLKQHIRRKHK